MDPYARYSSSLKKAKSFLEGKKKTPNGTPITQGQQLKLFQNRADCPICGTEFTGKNHNTEHIHPRALGGANEGKNKIQMCKLCNHCRNSTMQTFLLSPPYHKRYPDSWERIQEFIIWSEITIDDGLQAGDLFPEVHEIFMSERFAGLKPPKGPLRAFDRASTIDAATEPNYPHNNRFNAVKRRQTKNSSKPEKRGLFTRFFDRILGYDPAEFPRSAKTNNKVGKAESSVEPAAPDPIKPLPPKQTKPLPAENPPSKPRASAEETAVSGDVTQTDLSKRSVEDFVQFMVSILTLEPQSLSAIGRTIEQHLSDLNAPRTTTSYFLALHQFPRGLKKAIETHLGDSVHITGSAPKYFVALREGSHPNRSSRDETTLKLDNAPVVDKSFHEHVMASIADLEGEIKLSTLSPRLNKYFKSIGKEGISFRNFAKNHGIPKSRYTALEILQIYFSDLIGLRVEGTVVYIWRITENKK